MAFSRVNLLGSNACGVRVLELLREPGRLSTELDRPWPLPPELDLGLVRVPRRASLSEFTRSCDEVLDNGVPGLVEPSSDDLPAVFSEFFVVGAEDSEAGCFEPDGEKSFGSVLSSGASESDCEVRGVLEPEPEDALLLSSFN